MPHMLYSWPNANYYIWEHAIQMGFRRSQGCWHIVGVDQSRVVCVMRATLPNCYQPHCTPP